MRVTNQMMTANVLTNLNSLRSRMADLDSQVSSGKRFNEASGDPTAAGTVMRAQSRLSAIKQWQESQNSTRTWLSDSEVALSHLGNQFSHLKELASRAKNSTLDYQDRHAMAQEVDQILDDILTTLNSTGTDGALFGGFETEGTPFILDKIAGTATYLGDTGEMKREVGPGVTMIANIDGNQLGTNLLTDVLQFARDLDDANWPEGGPATPHMQNFDDITNDLLSLRTEVGAKMKRLEQLDTKTQETYVQMQGILQQAQGTDMEKAIIDMNSAETTYRAALQVGARIIPPTLADFLR